MYQDHKEREQKYRVEWGPWCWRMEDHQVEDLIQHCHNRFQFLRTYAEYQYDLDRMTTQISILAASGSYEFFCSLGVPQELLTVESSHRLLGEWGQAVYSKRQRAAEVFEFQYGVRIGTSVGSEQDQTRLTNAVPFHDTNALTKLAALSARMIACRDFDLLRADVGDLKSRLIRLSDEDYF